jgi:hypothetical protein
MQQMDGGEQGSVGGQAYCSSDADMGTTPACAADRPDDDNCSRSETEDEWS